MGLTHEGELNMVKLTRLVLDVLEVRGRGWLVKQWGCYYKTAASAQRRIHRDLPDNSILLLTWEPTTLGGRLAVDAITQP